MIKIIKIILWRCVDGYEGVQKEDWVVFLNIKSACLVIFKTPIPFPSYPSE